jgi:hypothetical protein
MRTAQLIILGLCFGAWSSGPQLPTAFAQENSSSSTKQEDPLPATSNDEIKFKLALMSNGWTKSGGAFSAMRYDTPEHFDLWLTIEHPGSREGAKSEYDTWLKRAERIIDQGKIEDKPATKPETIEDRAVIVLPAAAKDGKGSFVIVATAGNSFRIIQSSSLEAVLQFEKHARQSESLDDRFVDR